MSFASLYNSFARHPENSWIMKPYNAQVLYNFVKKYKPRRVLDLGTGIGVSVAIVALALTELGEEFLIDTVDHSEKCFDLAQKLIPKELQKNIKFHLKGVEAWSTEKMPYQFFSNFKEVAEADYNLIITDGPGEYLDGEHLINLPNGDVLRLHMEGKIKPGTFIFFDGRIRALGTIERYFAGDFYALDMPNNRCNILERKDSPVTFFDARKAEFEVSNYFSDGKPK